MSRRNLKSWTAIVGGRNTWGTYIHEMKQIKFSFEFHHHHHSFLSRKKERKKKKVLVWFPLLLPSFEISSSWVLRSSLLPPNSRAEFLCASLPLQWKFQMLNYILMRWTPSHLLLITLSWWFSFLSLSFLFFSEFLVFFFLVLFSAPFGWRDYWEKVKVKANKSSNLLQETNWFR